MRIARAALIGLAMTMTLSAAAVADNDPSVQQIYDEARAGHLDHAQQMITQVLADHPRSGKAHYVAAEIAARQGNASVARSELGRAEQLDPGLPFARPQAVQALKAEIGERGGATLLLAPERHSFPWGIVLVVGGVLLLLFMLFRRRNAPDVVGYPGGGYAAAPVTPGPYPAAPGGYAPGYGPPGGGGIGTGIAGGLASGLAVGAGVVAGEELAHHFLDGDRHAGSVQPVFTDPAPSNTEMGGNDFGINDPSGWDDAGGGGADGGDWS